MIKRKYILFIPIFIALFFIAGCQSAYQVTTESGIVTEISENNYTVKYDSVRVFDVTRVMENFRYDKKSHREKLMKNIETPEALSNAKIKPNYIKTYKLKTKYKGLKVGERVKNFWIDTKLEWTL